MRVRRIISELYCRNIRNSRAPTGNPRSARIPRKATLAVDQRRAAGADREHCDAMPCFMSAGEVMRLTRIGGFAMNGRQSGPLALFKKLRGVVDHVQITVAEDLGVGGRIELYDVIGALRNMVQNHLLQLLCLAAMEAPANLDHESVRNEKLKVLRALRPIAGADVKSHSVRGQYTAGAIDGNAVPGYLDELGSATAVPRPSWRSRSTSRTGAATVCAHAGEKQRGNEGVDMSALTAARMVQSAKIYFRYCYFLPKIQIVGRRARNAPGEPK